MGSALILVAVVFMAAVTSLWALTWTRPNTPYPQHMSNVMVLCHFDENTGVSTTNESLLPGDDLTLHSDAMWYSNGVFGTAVQISGANASDGCAWTDVDGDGLVDPINETNDCVIPWRCEKGMTVSFWIRVEDASNDYARTQRTYDIGKGWDNIYSRIETDPYSNMRFYPTAGRWQGRPHVVLRDPPQHNYIADGNWHHMGVVYDPDPPYIDHATNGYWGDWLLYVDNTNIFSSFYDGTTNEQAAGPGPDGGGMDLVAGTYNWCFDTNTASYRFYPAMRLLLGGNNGEDGIEIDELLIYEGIITNFSDGFTGAAPPGSLIVVQ